MTDIVAEIAAASKEQLVGVEQVNKAVAQMDRVTQGNAAQTEEMSGTASMLLTHAEQLSQLVGQFQLESQTSKSRSAKREEIRELVERRQLCRWSHDPRRSLLPHPQPTMRS